MILISKGRRRNGCSAETASSFAAVHETLARVAGTSWSSRSAVGMLLLDKSNHKIPMSPPA